MRQWMSVALFSVFAAVAQEAPKPAEVQECKSYVWVKEGAEKQDALLREVAAFLEKAGYFYLATCEGDGARVRPIKYTLVMDNKLAFVTSAKKEMFQQLLKNPKVELSRTAEDKSAYIRYKGVAVLNKDAAVAEKLLAVHPSFSKNFGADLALFLVEPEMVGIFPMKGGQPKTKTFTK